MTEQATRAGVRDAVQRWSRGIAAAGHRLVVEDTAAGTMVTVLRGMPLRCAARLFIERDTGTVFLVPSWVSRPAGMDRAVRDAGQRVRLAAI